MRRILLLLALLVLGLLLMPRELPATRTVGDQRRAERLRASPPRAADLTQRNCRDGESPLDRDPCLPIGALFAPAQ